MIDDLKEKPTVKQVAWVFKKLTDHINQPETFRFLIYDRMGFKLEDYSILVEDGMTIHNFLAGATKLNE